MSQFLLVVAVALTVGAIVFGIIVMVTGDDGGLSEAEPDGRAVPLPADRPLAEPDVTAVRFDTAVRGYRMAQVDAALRRLAYDTGYKDELIKVLHSEVDALREGRLPDAEVLRRAREAAAAPAAYGAAGEPDRETGMSTGPAPAQETEVPAEPAEAPAEPAEAPAEPAEAPAQPAEAPAGAADGPAAELTGISAVEVADPAATAVEDGSAVEAGTVEVETEATSGPFR